MSDRFSIHGSRFKRGLARVKCVVDSRKLSLIRHHCFNSGSVTKTEGEQNFLISATALKLNSTDTKEVSLERKYFTRRMPLFTPYHSSKICGCREAFTSTTIFGKQAAICHQIVATYLLY